MSDPTPSRAKSGSELLNADEQATLHRRSLLPIAIAARVDDVISHNHAPWELAYDQVGQILRRRHQYGQRPQWVVRGIRVDEPMDMTNPVTVPIDLRPDENPGESKARKRREYVEQIADSIIREGAPMADLTADFELEREVLTELWSRWRAATADGFLMRALESGR